MVQGILDNAEDFTPEQIATDFEGISLDVVRRTVGACRDDAETDVM
jgi:hypothetical protein